MNAIRPKIIIWKLGKEKVRIKKYGGLYLIIWPDFRKALIKYLMENE